MEKLKNHVIGLDGGSDLVSIAEEFPGSVERCLRIAEHWKKQVDSQNAVIKSEKPAVAVKTETERTEETLKGSGWCTIPKQSFQVPRGSFDVEFTDEDTMLLHGKSKSFTINLNQVKQIAVLPGPGAQPSKLLWNLKTPMPFGECLLVTPKPSPKSKLLQITIRDKQVEDEPCEVWMRVLAAKRSMIPVEVPSFETFKSSSGKHFMKCYHGVEDGLLYPLKSGVAFIQRPALFLPLQDLRIELKRMSGGGARNFDVDLIIPSANRTITFNMLEKEELEPFVRYVEKTKINAGQGGQGQGEEGEGNGETEEGKDGDDSDSSFDAEDENEDDDGSDGNESMSSSDRESDIDDGDCDLTKEVEPEEKSSIVETVRAKRRRLGETNTSSSSSSAPHGHSYSTAGQAMVDEEEDSSAPLLQGFEEEGEEYVKEEDQEQESDGDDTE